MIDLLRSLSAELTTVRQLTPSVEPPLHPRAFHVPEYIDKVVSGDPDAMRAAMLGVAAVQGLCNHVLDGTLKNGYAVVRPAGHHATAAAGGGGCIFANGVLGVLHLRSQGIDRVLYVDWDAHHGNSQQTAFWRDPQVLTISVHQARNFAAGTGGVDARGHADALGSNINVPVPMGSGGGVYREVFEQIVLPAAERFRPSFIIVSSGLDANYVDPSARLSLHSADFGWMAATLVEAADKLCGGRLVLIHEGGYALSYVPVCFLKIIESLSGSTTTFVDRFLDRWGPDFAASVPDDAARVIRTCAKLASEVPRG